MAIRSGPRDLSAAPASPLTCPPELILGSEPNWKRPRSVDSYGEKKNMRIFCLEIVNYQHLAGQLNYRQRVANLLAIVQNGTMCDCAQSNMFARPLSRLT